MQARNEPPSMPREGLHKYPKVVMAAGIIWIVVGAAILLSLLLVLLTQFDAIINAASGKAEAVAVGVVTGGLFGGVVGAFFLYEGVASIRGTVPSTLGIAIGSILLAIGLIVYRMDFSSLTDAALHLITPAGLSVAGILALIGRGQYEEWYRQERRRQQSRLPVLVYFQNGWFGIVSALSLGLSMNLLHKMVSRPNQDEAALLDEHLELAALLMRVVGDCRQFAGDAGNP
jgi:hypothetical protein